MNETKTCNKCGKTKSIEDFAKDKHRPDGRTYDCKACRCVLYRKWMAENPEKHKETQDRYASYRKEYYQRPEAKLKYRRKFIEKKYGIPYETYQKMVDAQRNVCYICERPEPDKRNAHLAIDHCHKTGKVRKLLCSRCNKVVGALEEDEELTEKIKHYIKTICKSTQ